ncbi:MAG: hypothetical protein ABSE16_08785 [Verrucomicrobiota bacterium]|jgi:hypothetical protein
MQNNAISPSSSVSFGNSVRPRVEILPSLVLAICLAAFLIKAVTSMVQESAT